MMAARVVSRTATGRFRRLVRMAGRGFEGVFLLDDEPLR